jgi:aminoglycoside phosphotransferase (APT) family kinase protein
MSRTQAVRKDENLDWQALDRYLQDKIPGLDGQPDISQYPAGNSNLTYCLRYPNAELVVRRPPFGSKVKSAHSMIREYRIMKALKPVFDAVPEVLAYSDDERIIGTEFYVMRRVEGVVAGERDLPVEWGLTESDTRRLCISFWSKLIDLHQVNYIDAGLEDFGRPAGYARRQIDGWKGRMQAAATADGETFEDVQDWLISNLPEEEPAATILHGDYRLDNVILDKDDPCKVIALLDWEICALGNPLMDLGNALAYWVEPQDPACLQTLMLQPSSAPGMLSRQEILNLYSSKTALDTSDFTFYYTYGIFRNAVILQQIYYRSFHKMTADARFQKFGSLVQALGKHCRELIAVS